MTSSAVNAPGQSVVRVAVGLALIPVFAWLTGRDGSPLRLWVFFLLVLLALKIIPVVARKLIPFPPETQARWFRQRSLGKWYDSYQWRKLLWVGVGLAAYLAVSRRVPYGQGALTLACLTAGGLGELAWRRIARTDPIVPSESR